MVIISIEHFVSNYVPIVILVTVAYSVYSATKQTGAETVYTGAVVYFLLASWLDYRLWGTQYTTIKYIEPTWSKRRGPKLYPSVLYLLGIVDDDGTAPPKEGQ